MDEGRAVLPVETVVAPVVAALAARRPKARYVSGSDARNLVRLGRMPVRVRDRLLIRTLGLRDLRPAGAGDGRGALRLEVETKALGLGLEAEREVQGVGAVVRVALV